MEEISGPCPFPCLDLTKPTAAEAHRSLAWHYGREPVNCPSCGVLTPGFIYHRGDPQPESLPDTDMDEALHGRDKMKICVECGFDLDADF